MSAQEPPRPPAPPTPPTQPLGAPVQPVVPVARAAYAEPVVERLPPEGPWWDNPWPAIVTGILALIVGGLIGYAIGDKGESSSEAQRAGAPVTRTVDHTTTVIHPKVVVHTVTSNTVTQTTSPANAENEQRRSEAEASLRKAERENEELKRQLEEP
jgi:hypothetical protein